MLTRIRAATALSFSPQFRGEHRLHHEIVRCEIVPLSTARMGSAWNLVLKIDFLCREQSGTGARSAPFTRKPDVLPLKILLT